MNEKMIFHQLGKDQMYKIWHASKENMIMYIYSGEGSIVCSENIYPIEKGVLCFVGAEKYHYTMPEDACCYDRSKLLILPESFNRLLAVMEKESWFSRFSEGSFVYAKIPEGKQWEVEEIFREMEETKKEELYIKPVWLALCIKLLVLLDKYSLKSTSQAQAQGAVSKAIEYINQHIFAEIHIDEICEAVHMSKYYFCRRFKESIGMTVMEYILKTRVVMAKNMLQKEQVSITEVSEQCGFSSISYFCRVFKEETGMTPLKYKKSMVK